MVWLRVGGPLRGSGLSLGCRYGQGVLAGADGDEAGELELLLDGGHEALLNLVDTDLGDDLVEEAQDDEATGLGLGDAAGPQVEELLVVEAAGGAGVAGTLDVAFSISRFGTESALAPSVRTRLRLSS